MEIHVISRKIIKNHPICGKLPQWCLLPKMFHICLVVLQAIWLKNVLGCSLHFGHWVDIKKKSKRSLDITSSKFKFKFLERALMTVDVLKLGLSVLAQQHEWDLVHSPFSKTHIPVDEIDFTPKRGYWYLKKIPIPLIPKEGIRVRVKRC